VKSQKLVAEIKARNIKGMGFLASKPAMSQGLGTFLAAYEDDGCCTKENGEEYQAQF